MIVLHFTAYTYVVIELTLILFYHRNRRIFQLITAQGRKVMVKSMNELGVIVMERILVQQLPQSACILNNDQPEYLVINTNHCIETARSLFLEMNFTWLCDLVDVCLRH
jgi:hypothetical protein